MKKAIEMSTGAMVCIPRPIMTGAKVAGGGMHIQMYSHTHTRAK
jgi:hypothetical protein